MIFQGILFIATAAVATEPVNIDDVACALCHFEQGDEFSASVHHERGLILCNDCHGGLPFEVDDAIAKAAGTGYIGKPSRDRIGKICAQCHTASEQHFSSGPHGKWEVIDNPTCVTCHHNHHVLEASPDLLGPKCMLCHTAHSEEVERWNQMIALLEAQKVRVASAHARLMSLAPEARTLRRSVSMIEYARGSLREAEPATHELDISLIALKVEEAQSELGRVEISIAEYFAEQLRRRWIVGLVWIFVAVNVALLWVRRKQPTS